MSHFDSDMVPLTLHDAASFFSKEEWTLLHEWQKELYRNVMNEIHQALISLGPLIATSVLSLKAKEKDDVLHVNSEKMDSSRCSSSAKSCKMDVQIKICQEETHCLKDPPGIDESEHTAGMSAVPEEEAYLPIASVSIKEEANTYSMELDDANGREITDGPREAKENMAPAASFDKKNHRESCSLYQEEPYQKGNICNTTDDAVDISAHTQNSVNEEDPHFLQVHSTGGRSTGTNKSGASNWEQAYNFNEFGTNFNQKLDIHGHPITHPDRNLYACPEYGSSFSQGENFVKHEGTYQRQKTSTWNEDGQSFNEEEATSLQQELHPAVKMCICSQCGNIFNQSTSQEEQKNTCRACENTFCQATNLNNDVVAHIENQAYVCNECGKSFRKSQVLIRHQRIHTGERPHRCNECGKTFREAHGLVIHKRQHTGEKPYKCSKCGRNFRQVSHLIKHERMHTGEKPYICTACERRFTDSSTLKRHQQIHIRENS